MPGYLNTFDSRSIAVLVCTAQPRERVAMPTLAEYRAMTPAQRAAEIARAKAENKMVDERDARNRAAELAEPDDDDDTDDTAL